MNILEKEQKEIRNSQKMKYLVFLFLFVPTYLLSFNTSMQRDTSFIFTGTVYDREEANPLQSVTIRVAGTHVGTFTKRDGTFSLKLLPGKHTIMFSMVGKERQIIDIDLRKDIKDFEIFLKTSSSITDAIVVIAEDPGERIMRNVIGHKKRYLDSISTYTYMLYTKFIASTDSSTAGRSEDFTDTTIVSIFESFSKGYFRAPDSYFNEIIQRRQSKNIPPQANFVTLGTNINSYDDYVTILGEKIATPFHPDANNFYEFILDDKYRNPEDSHIARVLAYPDSKTRKMFTGTMLIDTNNLMPVSVEFSPSRSVQLPFSAILRFNQTFERIDNKFLMPSVLNIFASAEAEILWLFSPRLDINISTRAFDYNINVPIDDRIFNRRRVEAIPSASEFDSTFWASNMIIQLSDKELQAYESIRRNIENPDSALRQGFLDQFFGEISRTIAKLDRKPFTGFEDVFSYNLIHGLYLGIGLETEITHDLAMITKVGYGFADNELYGRLELRYDFDELKLFSAYGALYKTLNRSDNLSQIRKPAITTISLLNGRDYGDYYYAQGFEVGLDVGVGQLVFLRRDRFFRPKRTRIYFSHEQQANAFINTDFSLFGNKIQRENPMIITGINNSIGIELNWNFHPRRRFSKSGFQLNAEYSEKSLESDFNYLRFHGSFFTRFNTLPSWEVDFRFSGGYSIGELPPQKFFSLESSTSGIASAGSLRAMNMKEFYGSEFFIASLEHNFGELIPGILRIPSVASFGIEFITYGRLAYTNFTRTTLFASKNDIIIRPNTTQNTADKYYYEVGLGLNKILLFFRMDATIRLSQTSKPRFLLTFTNAVF